MVKCPVCGLRVSKDKLVEHLETKHGYDVVKMVVPSMPENETPPTLGVSTGDSIGTRDEVR